jgi:hypothetical protein
LPFFFFFFFFFFLVNIEKKKKNTKLWTKKVEGESFPLHRGKDVEKGEKMGMQPE